MLAHAGVFNGKTRKRMSRGQVKVYSGGTTALYKREYLYQ